MSHRGRRGGATRVAAAVAVACAAIAWLSPQVGAQPAGDEFLAGSGRAIASLLTPTVSAGQLSVSVLIGEASARYQDETAVATSTAIEVPLLALAGGLKVCGQGVVPAGALPPAMTADTNETGNAKPVSRSASNGALRQSAHATPRASANSETKTVELNLPGLIRMSGAVTTAESFADPSKQVRSARATTRIATVDVLGGLVRLDGLQWDLSQRQVGADSRSDERSKTGTFSLGDVTVAGERVPIAVDGDTLSLTQANKALAPLGVQLRLPGLTSATGADRHNLSPLQIVLGGEAFAASPVFATLLTNPQVNQVLSRFFSRAFDPKDCAQFNGAMQSIPAINAYYNTVGSYTPLLLAVMSGVVAGGDITLDVGGAATSLDDTYVAPVTFGGAQLSISNSLTSTESLPSALDPLGLSIVPAIPRGRGAMAPIAQRCETSSPAGRPGCWLGRAPLGAAVAGAFAIVLFVTDEFVRRRRTREEATA